VSRDIYSYKPRGDQKRPQKPSERRKDQKYYRKNRRDIRWTQKKYWDKWGDRINRERRGDSMDREKIAREILRVARRLLSEEVKSSAENRRTEMPAHMRAAAKDQISKLEEELKDLGYALHVAKNPDLEYKYTMAPIDGNGAKGYALTIEEIKAFIEQLNSNRTWTSIEANDVSVDRQIAYDETLKSALRKAVARNKHNLKLLIKPKHFMVVAREGGHGKFSPVQRPDGMFFDYSLFGYDGENIGHGSIKVTQNGRDTRAWKGKLEDVVATIESTTPLLFRESSIVAGMYDKINFVPPEGAAREAKKALKWKEEKGSEVKGGTRVGWTRANQLAKREELSPDTVKRMYNFFNRHEKNAAIKPEFKSEPWRDNGYVAWLIWGGDAGRSWANKLWKQMEAAEAKTAMRMGMRKRVSAKTPQMPYDMNFDVFQLHMSEAAREQIISNVVASAKISFGRLNGEFSMLDDEWHNRKIILNVTEALGKTWDLVKQGNDEVRKIGRRAFTLDPDVLLVVREILTQGHGLIIPGASVEVEIEGATFGGAQTTRQYKLGVVKFDHGTMSESTAIIIADITPEDIIDLNEKVMSDIES